MQKVTPSVQDYLKAILELSKGPEPVRSIDIAAALGYSRASVSKAMNGLKTEGYITKEKYGGILLTDLGRNTAGIIKKRNQVIRNFLTDVLGVESDAAKNEACRIEHVISMETTQKLEDYIFNGSISN